jgi:hypothetical protein
VCGIGILIVVAGVGNGVNGDSWTTCTTEVAPPPELVGDFVETRLQLETSGAACQSMDVDNLKMELLDGSVTTSIIVPSADGIESYWGGGGGWCRDSGHVSHP